MKLLIAAATALLSLHLQDSILHAEIMPPTKQELWDGADAVVLAEVVSLTRSAETSHQGTPVFIAELCVRQALKGDVRTGHILVWHVAVVEAPPGGEGGSLVYPGDRGKLYLRKDSTGNYDTWNAASTQWIVRQDVATKELPNRIGDSIRLDTPNLARTAPSTGNRWQSDHIPCGCRCEPNRRRLHRIWFR